MKKVWKRIGLGVLTLLVVVVIVVIVNANINVKAMNACIDQTIATISKDHKVTEIPAGEYASMRAYGVMNFHVKQYEIEDIGNMSVMTVNIGLMQMATVVITPFDKDIPLLSCDYMYILSNRKAYIEVYDLVNEMDDTYISWLSQYQAAIDGYSDLEDTTASKAWYESLVTAKSYKAGKHKDDEKLQELLIDTVSVYLSQADAYNCMSEEEMVRKNQIIKAYSDRLIDEGGISTDFFKKAFGEEVTRAFFDQVFFGTARMQ